MQDVIAFIENLTIEPRLHWCVPHLYTTDMYDLEWHKSSAPKRWRLRKKGCDEWQTLAYQELVSILQEQNIDLEATRRLIAASIVTQAVYASLVVEGAEKILGEEKLQQAFASTNKFLFALLNQVSSILDKQEGADSPRKKRPLHLIDGNHE